MINFLRKFIPMFKPTIIKIVSKLMNDREEEDINFINGILSKYDLGLSGEQQDKLVHDLHEAAETIILSKLEAL